MIGCGSVYIWKCEITFMFYQNRLQWAPHSLWLMFLVLIHSREEWRITTSRKFLHEDDFIDQKGPDHAGKCNWTINSLCCKAPQSSSHKDSWPHLRFWSWQTECCLKTAKKILHLSLVHSFPLVIIQHMQQLDKQRFALNRKISFDLQWKPLLAITAHLIWNQ